MVCQPMNFDHAMQGLRENIERHSTVKIALKKIDLLNYNCSGFLEKLTSEFTLRAEKMQLLEAEDLRDNFTKRDI